MTGIEITGSLDADRSSVAVEVRLDGEVLAGSPLRIYLSQWDRLRDLAKRDDMRHLTVEVKDGQ